MATLHTAASSSDVIGPANAHRKVWRILFITSPGTWVAGGFGLWSHRIPFPVRESDPRVGWLLACTLRAQKFPRGSALTTRRRSSNWTVGSNFIGANAKLLATASFRGCSFTPSSRLIAFLVRPSESEHYWLMDTWTDSPSRCEQPSSDSSIPAKIRNISEQSYSLRWRAVMSGRGVNTICKASRRLYLCWRTSLISSNLGFC